MIDDTQLDEGKILPLLIKFSIPTIVGMLVNALYNVIDRIFIGNATVGMAGPLGIAGLSICQPIMIATLAFSLLIGIGGATRMAISLGQKNKEAAEKIIGNSFVSIIFIGILITVVGTIFMNPMLRAFGADEEVLPYAAAYMGIILLGAPINALGFVMNRYMLVQGFPALSMGTMMIGAAMNVVLAPIFIYVLQMGMKGAAIATVLSQCVSAVWVMSFYFTKKCKVRLRLKNLNPDFRIILSIISIGMAPFATQIAVGSMNIVMNKSLGFYGGNIAISAMGGVVAISMIILMPIFGINQGAQPIIGYNYGAMRFDRVKETLKYAMIFGSCLIIISYLAVMIFPGQLMALFGTGSKEFLEHGVTAIRTYLFALPLVGVQVIGAMYFQAVGKPLFAMIFSLSRQVIFLIPAMLILPITFGLNGVYMSGPVADILSFLVTTIFLFFELKNLDNRHVAQQLI